MPASRAVAEFAPVADGTLEAWRAEVSRHGRPLDDGDLARIHGLVQRVRAGPAPLSSARTLDLEPDLRFVPPDA